MRPKRRHQALHIDSVHSQTRPVPEDYDIDINYDDRGNRLKKINALLVLFDYYVVRQI